MNITKSEIKEGQKILVIMCVILIGITAGIVIYFYNQQKIIVPEVGVQRMGAIELYPDLRRTPGAINTSITQDNISQNLCNPNWSTKSERPPASYTTNLKVTQLNSGYAYQNDLNTKDYEEDHLISLELGGNPTDEKNLWPESYNTQPVGAKAKDKVENYLHKQLCAGNMTLKEVQTAIVDDWYGIYLKMGNNLGGVNSDLDDEQ